MGVAFSIHEKDLVPGVEVVVFLIIIHEKDRGLKQHTVYVLVY